MMLLKPLAADATAVPVVTPSQPSFLVIVCAVYGVISASKGVTMRLYSLDLIGPGFNRMYFFIVYIQYYILSTSLKFLFGGG